MLIITEIFNVANRYGKEAAFRWYIHTDDDGTQT